MLKSFLQEAKWSYNKDMPTFRDYLDNAWVSVSGVVILVHTYFLLNQTVTKQALGGLEKYHDLLRWPSMIFRLSNDLSTFAVLILFFFSHPHVVLFCAKLDFKIYIIVSKITLIYFVVCLKNRQS